LTTKVKRQYLIFSIICIILLLLMPYYYGMPLGAEQVPQEIQPLEGETITLGELGLHIPELELIGTFKVTNYTPDPDENGGWADGLGNGITSTGHPVVPGYTAAVKSGSLPVGTIIMVEGRGTFVVDDCGVGSGQIDLAVESQEIAQQLGVQQCRVWIVTYGVAG